MSKLPVAVVVIPTYNEAKNIGKMIEYLNTKTFPHLAKKWDMKILVVDGNSPDGTAEIVKNLSKKYISTHLFLETSKDGLGAAYLKGFKYAMEELKADAVFEFDADFQHPPEMIAPMLDQIENGYDYVLGSRKVKGGSNPKGWGFKRIFFSEAGGLTARFLLFFPLKNFFKVTDPTTGLKVTRVKGFLDHLDLSFSHLHTKGFAYKMQLLFETLKLGAKYKEVPLVFHVRTEGVSKIEGNAVIDGIKVCFLTRWYDDVTQKFIKFGCIGLFGFVINKIGLDLFSKALSNLIETIGVRNFIANALAAEVSIISNFILNNLWTFKNEKLIWGKVLLQKFATFNLGSVISGIVIPSIIIGAGTQVFGDQYRTLLLVIAVFFFTVPLNWFIYNLVIWKKKK
jgi:dolichol-phosphate mannosyltransferase